jgi:hypothetical protein
MFEERIKKPGNFRKIYPPTLREVPPQLNSKSNTKRWHSGLPHGIANT